MLLKFKLLSKKFFDADEHNDPYGDEHSMARVRYLLWGERDPEETLQKCQKLVHNDGFPSLKLLYYSQNTVKFIKIH